MTRLPIDLDAITIQSPCIAPLGSIGNERKRFCGQWLPRGPGDPTMTRLPIDLDAITIQSPCTVPWESMKGNERKRFCGQCRLHVHDISQLTRREAVALLEETGGECCLRLWRRPDGTVSRRTAAACASDRAQKSRRDGRHEGLRPRAPRDRTPHALAARRRRDRARGAGARRLPCPPRRRPHDEPLGAHDGRDGASSPAAADDADAAPTRRCGADDREVTPAGAVTHVPRPSRISAGSSRARPGGPRSRRRRRGPCASPAPVRCRSGRARRPRQGARPP